MFLGHRLDASALVYPKPENIRSFFGDLKNRKNEISSLELHL
jgi:hypothetical protein